MCIVIYKPANIKIPVSYLRNSFINNPHGAGFMWIEDDLVHGLKGFMNINDLLTSLEDLGHIEGSQLVSTADMVLHFRFATHGGISNGKCHPFPASNNEEELHLLEWKHPYGVAHNGIVSNYAETGLSDTQGFIKQVLSDKDIIEDLKNKSTLKLLSNLTAGSKFVILSPEQVTLLGSWEKVRDVYYSNDDYLRVFPITAVDYEDYFYYEKDGADEKDEVIDVVDYMDDPKVGPYKLYNFCEHEDNCQECVFIQSNGMECEIWGEYYAPNYPDPQFIN